MNSTYSELLKQRSELDQKIEEARMQELDAALKQKIGRASCRERV